MTTDTIYWVPTLCLELYRHFLTILRSWLLLFPFYLWENRGSEWLNNLPRVSQFVKWQGWGSKSFLSDFYILFLFTIFHHISQNKWEQRIRLEDHLQVRGDTCTHGSTPITRVLPSIWVSSWLVPPVTPCQAPKGHSCPFNSWIRAWQNSLFIYPFNTTETGWYFQKEFY